MLKTSEISDPYKKYSIQVLNYHLINFNVYSSPEQIATDPEKITGPSPCLYGIQQAALNHEKNVGKFVKGLRVIIFYNKHI